MPIFTTQPAGSAASRDTVSPGIPISNQHPSRTAAASRIYFLHIPKCGGTSVAHLWRSMYPGGVRAPNLKYKTDIKHCLITHIDDTYDFSFATVRHPVSWYESWWRYLLSPKVTERQETLDAAGKPNWDTWIGQDVWHPLRPIAKYHDVVFARFIDNMMSAKPGFVSSMYRSYLGEYASAPTVDHIIKMENLHSEFSRMCRINHLRPPSVQKHENKSSASVIAEWAPGQKQRISDQEQDAIKRFKYDPV